MPPLLASPGRSRYLSNDTAFSQQEAGTPIVGNRHVQRVFCMGSRKAYITVHPIRVLDVKVDRRLEENHHAVRKSVGRQVAFLHQRLAIVDNLRDVLREAAQLVGCFDKLQAYMEGREKQRSGSISL